MIARALFERLRGRPMFTVRVARRWHRATHTAYPESSIADDGSWRLRFYSYTDSGVVEETAGKAATPRAARARVRAAIAAGLAKYRRVRAA